MRLKSTSGVAVPAAVPLVFGTGLVSSARAGDAAKIHCAGLNACKGQSACKRANNVCKGVESCKRQGFSRDDPQRMCRRAGRESAPFCRATESGRQECRSDA
jgi:hypothetical protein